jgi:hypothetical protein
VETGLCDRFRWCDYAGNCACIHPVYGTNGRGQPITVYDGYSGPLVDQIVLQRGFRAHKSVLGGGRTVPRLALRNPQSSFRRSKPSRDDIEMTREIKAVAEALGIVIHDHLVIGCKGHASFRSLGLLT